MPGKPRKVHRGGITLTFLHLGIVNALRNLGRSTMTVLAMALAAFMMTASLTVAEGYTPFRAENYRAFLGGDILVYPGWTWPTGEQMESVAGDGSGLGEAGDPAAGGGQSVLRLEALRASFVSPLRYFHPNYYWDGYLTGAAGGAPAYSMFGSLSELEAAKALLASHPDVAGVSVYSGAPILAGVVERPGAGPAAGSGANQAAGAALPCGSVLRLCPPALLAEPGRETAAKPGADPSLHLSVADGPGLYLGAGRWLTEGDGPAAAMVNAAAMPGVQPGARLRATVPALARPPGDAGATTYGDPAQAITLELEVVGTYQLYGRLLHYQIDRQDYYEALFFDGPEILLAPAAYEGLLAAMGLQAGESPPAGALLVRVADQSRIEATTRELRALLPDLSLITVARELAYANSRGLPEPIRTCPWEHRPHPLPLTQPVIPAGSKVSTGVVLFAFAGLAAAGNSTLLVIGRRKEFAILKATGLRGHEIALVVLVEVLTLGLLGFLAGFGAAELSALPILLTNAVAPVDALGRLLRDAAVVGLATIGASAVFALVPMVKTLSVSVAEVMRGEA